MQNDAECDGDDDRREHDLTIGNAALKSDQCEDQ